MKTCVGNLSFKITSYCTFFYGKVKPATDSSVFGKEDLRLQHFDSANLFEAKESFFPGNCIQGLA